jgi:hypothetical protein
MVQRDPSPRGDKNGADINLALDALEMAFTHDHINAFAIVSGDSDFIALVNKLKQYDKRIFVVGGRAFTSTILQKNCHEFISYESLLVESRPAREPRREQPQPQPQSAGQSQPSQSQPQPQQQERTGPPPHQGGGQQRQPHRRPAPLDLAQAMPLVDRALQVLERREVRPQLGLLKSTMLQLDSTFNEKAYGSGSFTDFVEKLQKENFVTVTGGEGRYMIKRKSSAAEKASARPEEALPVLRDVLETHRLDVDNGCPAEDLAGWVKEEHPTFNWQDFGFQEFGELLNYAQDKMLVRVSPAEEHGLMVHLGPEFHPPAPPPESEPEISDEQPTEEPQPMVMGQPVAEVVKAATRRPRAPRKKAATSGDGNAAVKRRAPRRKKTPEA